MHGNPWLRLLRREVEDLVRTRHGERYLREQNARTELAQINRELKQLRARLAALEEAGRARCRPLPARRSSSVTSEGASATKSASRRQWRWRTARKACVHEE